MPNNPPFPPVLRAEEVFHRGSQFGDLLGVSVAIEPAKFTLLSGPPGSGAGSLLRVLALLDRPDPGEVWFEAHPTAALDENERLDYRNHAFGFVFSEPFLLDSFTVAENVAMPLFKISGFDIEEARARTAEVLEFAGLANLAECTVYDLPLLERHKLAIARALGNSPRVLIVEEAGLQLPPRELAQLATLLRAVPGQLNAAVIATSPSELLAPDREIRLENGIVVADTTPVAAND